MRRAFVFFGAFFGGLGVVLGAFGAHTVRARLTPELLEIFETGVRYEIYHALALLILASMPVRASTQRWLTLSGWLFVVGILLFSGSLYLLTLSGIRALGIITPMGGMALILGWLFLMVTAFRSHDSRNRT